MPRASRRTFLRGAAAVAAAAAAQTAGLAARAPAPRFNIGYQIFGWGRYFPSAWWHGAAAVGGLGFRGIEGEYTIVELYEGREDEFADHMKRCGVRLAALYSTTDLERAAEGYENVRKNLQAAAFCRRMGARMIVVGGTEAKARGAEPLRQYAAAANELGKRVYESHGVRVGVHPHVGSIVESREEIARVMDATDPRYFWLAPDTGHLVAGGSDPVEVFKTYRSRIAHAHLKDYALPQAGAARGSFVPLGKGSVNFPALLEIIGSSPFDGWLDVELDGGRGVDPLDAARAAREYLTGSLGLTL